METATPIPKPGIDATLANLSKAYAQSEQGQYVNPELVAQDLTNLYTGLTPQQRKDASVRTILKNCGPLAKDLITDPEMLRAIYPERYTQPSNLKEGLINTGLALGTLGIGIAGLLSQSPEVSSHQSAEPNTPVSDTFIPSASPVEIIYPIPATTPTNTPTESPSPTATRTATKTATASPTLTPSPSLTPTINVAEQAKKEYGNINMAEYFLGNLTKILKEKRLEKARYDPAFAERIDEEFLNSNSINLLYLGIDNTREREGEFNPDGLGRSDVTMLITFNPHTFQINAISFPRDTFAPELTSYRFTGGARINAATMAPLVDSQVNSFELSRKIVETATGIPVDGVIKTNIDFTQGFGEENMPSIFDDLFPNGLNIHVPYTVTDNEYPTAHYGSKKLEITKGDHVMNGRQLTELARSRHSSSDFDRADRQRLILQASLKQLLPDLVKDFIAGQTTTLDRVITSLNKQQELTNLSSDLNIVEILKTIKGGTENLRKDPKGLATLALLAANSSDVINKVMQNKDNTFSSIGLSRGNGLVANVGEREIFYWPYMLKINGSTTDSKPTQHGNHLKYWAPLRKYIKEAVVK